MVVGKPRSAYTLITPSLPVGNPVDDSNTWIRIHQRRLHHLRSTYIVKRCCRAQSERLLEGAYRVDYALITLDT